MRWIRRVPHSDCTRERPDPPSRFSVAGPVVFAQDARMQPRCEQRRRLLWRIATPSLVLACGCLLLAAPQLDPKAAGKKWTVSRTPDGQPDLQGMWTNYDA